MYRPINIIMIGAICSKKLCGSGCKFSEECNITLPNVILRTDIIKKGRIGLWKWLEIGDFWGALLKGAAEAQIRME